MLELVAYAPNEVRRLPLPRGRWLIGSGAECDLLLPFDGVLPEHARIERTADSLSIEPIGPEAEIRINGRPASGSSPLELLDEIELGGLTTVISDPEETERQLDRVPSSEGGAVPPMTPSRMVERLSRLSNWVVGDAVSETSLETLVSDLLRGFGGGACLLFQGDLQPEPTIKLAVATDAGLLDEIEGIAHFVAQSVHRGPGSTMGQLQIPLDGERSGWGFYRFVRALERSYCMVIVLPDHAAEWRPDLGFAAVADLLVLGLVHHVGRYEPLLPGHGGHRELVLAPGLVVGPSERMAVLLERMKAVADTRENVLIRGEPGSGRRLVARTLHLSSRWRHGPFVTVDCRDADPSQIEAELFGAVVRGRSEPVRREAKLALAQGGTLLICEVEYLPPELQGRLARALRTGRYRSPGEDEAMDLEVRLVATSSSDLAQRVRQGLFRVDLAMRLAQFHLVVPALGERMEDLPLLVQTSVNRYSHEAGKRIRGISVRALTALSRHHFPGNLQELENIVRQMVYMAVDESPLDVDLLPESVRKGAVEEGVRPDLDPSLALAELTDRVHRQAIREALRRAHGNKTRAAKLLGISRNGLAQKMARLEIE